MSPDLRRKLVTVFLGRGQKSHAYTHSVQDGHHVFLNLQSQKFYCLPDNYEVIDSSLDDIIVSNSGKILFKDIISIHSFFFLSLDSACVQVI